ncbi:MAG: T9SS type A sorting domain-containing protein [Bacteroidia bacterium]|nr:T9SS type A sorting domain-containing protein [Bacteroidia bacterium]
MWYTGASAIIGIGYAEEPVHCFPDGVTFTCQAEIDNFKINNPDCRVIKGDVIISGSDIINLNGLNVLTYIVGSLEIQNNNLLTSLSGLENIDPSSIEELWITNNPNLSFCAVKSICDYLVNPAGSIIIFNNAPGCNNPEEVEEVCHTITSVSEANSSCKFTISPNPFSGVVTLQFSIKENGLTTIDLYQASGIRIQRLLKETKMPGTYNLDVDLSDLQPGIYLVRMMTGDDLKVKKVVKL